MNTPLKIAGSQSISYARVEEPQDSPQEIGWPGILLLLRRQILRVIGVAALVCLIALPVILALPRLYYAETRMLLRSTPVLDLAAGTDVQFVPVNTPAEIERILSHPATAEVAQRFTLSEREEFNIALRPEGLTDWLREMVHAAAAVIAGPVAGMPEAPQVADRVHTTFREALTVSRQGPTDVVTIGFTSRDPDLATAIPAALADTYQRQSQEAWRSDLQAGSAWLDARIDAEQTRLVESRAALNRSLESLGAASGESPDTISAQTGVLEARRGKIADDLADLRSIRHSIEAALAAPERPAIDEPMRLQELRRDLRQQRRDLDELATVYGEKHPGLTVNQNRIAMMETDIRRELMAYDETLDLRREGLENERAELDREAARLRGELRDMQRQAPERERLMAALQAQELRLSELRSRRTALQSMIPVTPTLLEVLVPPVRPIHALGPSRQLYLAAAGITGLLLGLLAAGLAELRDHGLRSFAQLPHLPRLIPVGLVPAVRRRLFRGGWPARRGAAVTPAITALEDALFLVECGCNGRLPPVLVVAEARQGDAVIPVARWVTDIVSARGVPVWLVEFDGAGAGRMRDPVNRNVTRVSWPATCLRGHDVAARLGALEGLARDAGGLVIVDAPPLHLTRSLDLVRIAGTVLVVLRWGATPRPLVELLAGLLDKLGTVQAFGLIVDVNPGRHRLYGFNDRLSLLRRGWHARRRAA